MRIVLARLNFLVSQTSARVAQTTRDLLNSDAVLLRIGRSHLPGEVPPYAVPWS